MGVTNWNGVSGMIQNAVVVWVNGRGSAEYRAGGRARDRTGTGSCMRPNQGYGQGQVSIVSMSISIVSMSIETQSGLWAGAGSRGGGR